ncbi:MAG: thioredoxin-dependent thiol peroxidase [Candidatus Shapirobacteria bacterium]|nr:thioredoxin-dependent thiol peroxidase [Candidatus Shapirobacteria bacterium]
MNIKVGKKAPGFCLPDQNDETRCLKDYVGKWVLVYFYPKDDTPGCTKEACGMRDNLSNFNRIDLVVLGISKDSVKSHQKFAKKYNLNFPILADEDTKVNQLYEVWQSKKFMGREFIGTVRSSFLIDPEGKIAKIYNNVKPEGHAQEVITDLSEKVQ